jgi:hypothetical protein
VPVRDDVTAAAGWANQGSRHSRNRVVSSVQVKFVMRGGGGPITSVSRGNWTLGRPSFFQVKAFSQMRYSVHGSEYKFFCNETHLKGQFHMIFA